VSALGTRFETAWDCGFAAGACALAADVAPDEAAPPAEEWEPEEFWDAGGRLTLSKILGRLPSDEERQAWARGFLRGVVRCRA
jgi:hypothetical protein